MADVCVSGFSDACGGILNSMSGQLMVLYTDSNTYESSLLCKWTIPGGPDEYIRFLITAMNIQKNELCEFDSIEVCSEFICSDIYMISLLFF